MASELVLPSRVTVLPVTTFWLLPAFATGAALLCAAVMVTVTALLVVCPSLTVNVAVYAPGRSAVKVGMTAVDEDKFAVLPVGLVVNDQL